jgi:flagellar basal-body rod protein FlgF
VNRAVYTAASGGIAALARLEAVTQNVANVSTAGYKASRVVFTVRPLDGEPRALDPIAGQAAVQVRELATVRDFAQGPVRLTGNPLDVAITGPGFFAVQTPHGERYTRQGTFGLDRDGYLATAHGERVLGDGGGDGIRIGTGDVAIGGDGTVTVDGTGAGRLKLVDFGAEPALVPEGNALFAPAPGAVPVDLDASAVQLQSAAVEGANVDAVAGMIELVDVSRGFETYMQTMQRLDKLAERSITDVGRVG